MNPKDLVAASAEPLILSLLSRGESYGYAILRDVHKQSSGRIEWTDGMLYPVLHRLERKGLVKAKWRVSKESGRKRKYYSLLSAGKKELKQMRTQWETVNDTLRSLWEASHA